MARARGLVAVMVAAATAAFVLAACGGGGPQPHGRTLLGATSMTAQEFGLAGRIYFDWVDRTSIQAKEKLALLVPRGPQSIRLINLRWSERGQVAPFEQVLAGQYDADIDAWFAIIRGYQDALAAAGLSRGLILTDHHEVLPSEFAPGEDTHDWGRVGEYVIDRADALGMRDLYWAPCLIGVQYASGEADRYYTPGLLQKAWAIGVDAYMDQGNDTASKAFASTLSYAAGKGKDKVVILETAAREPLDGSWHLDQRAAYLSLWNYLKSQPEIVACFLWNAVGDRFTDRLDPTGAAVVGSMARDPFFGRTVTP